MNEPHFTTAFAVDQTPDEAFSAINHVRNWWSEDIEGDTDRLGGEFTFRHQDVHHSKHLIIEFIPNEKIVWLVLDAQLNFIKNKAEWKGTKNVFEIARKGHQTEIRFTHVGLQPESECFEACSSAWRFYINTSLRNLIATGAGQPGQRTSKRTMNDQSSGENHAGENHE